MGTLLTFTPLKTLRRTGSSGADKAGEVVFFPGVRIERHTVDLSKRIGRPATRGRGKPGKRS